MDNEKVKSNVQKMLLFCSKIGSNAVQLNEFAMIENCEIYLDKVERQFEELEAICLERNQQLSNNKAYVMHYKTLRQCCESIQQNKHGKLIKITNSQFNHKKYEVIF